jgi:uncharacterized membrane protein HdeD (DUF308 family)
MSSGAVYGTPDEPADRSQAAVLGFDVSKGAAIFAGAVSVIFGLLIMFWPDVTIKAVAVLFGIQLLVHGAFRLAQSFAITDVGGGSRALLAVLGVLSIIVGVLCLRNVLQTIAVLTLLLGLFWLVGGIIELFRAITDESMPNRGLAALSGALGAVAGIVVLVWPEITVLALAVVLGIWLVLFGVIAIVAGLRAGTVT